MTHVGLAGVADWHREGDTVVCRTTTHRVDGAGPPDSLTDGRRPRLAVEFLSPDAVRLQLQPDPEAVPADESPLGLDYDTLRTETDLTVEPDGNGDPDTDTVRAATDGLTAEIDTASADLRIRDAGRDRTLLATGSQTDSRDRPVVPPTGFTETERGGWPLVVDDTHLAVQHPPAEHVFGCGEQFGGVDHRGDRITARVRQPNGTGSRETYFPVPLYLSDRGYGVFVDTAADATFDFGATAPGTTSLSVADSALSLVVFRGDPETVLEQYTALTGRPPRLPAWTFGVWWSRNSYESADEVRAVADRLRETDTPGDLLHLDPGWMDLDELGLSWDEDGFPDPETLLADLADDGFHVSVWEYPYLKAGTAPFATARDRGYLVEDGAGRPLVVRRPSKSDTRAGILDFTDPDAVAWWQERHRRLLDQGVDVFKTDFGEYLPPEAVTSDGRTGRTTHNRYPVDYQRAVAGAFDETTTGDETTTDDETPLLWSRSGWAGAQQYPVHWGGDAASTEAGFADTVRGGLSLAASGVPLWSCDIGGYKPEPSPDLYRRWAQWGLLALSHPRFHGKTPREPWHYGDEVAATVRRYARLRYRLLPYLYRHGVAAARRGLPVLRPVHVARPDADVPADALQHFVGDSLLVVPDLAPGEPLDVHLPAGEWIDHWTGESHQGPTRLRLSSPRSELPAFWAAGTVVPEQEPGPHVAACEDDPLTLRVFPDSTDTTDPADATDATNPTDATATGAWFDTDTETLRETRVELADETLTVTLPADSSRAVRVLVEGVATLPETVRVRRDETVTEPSPAAVELGHETADATRETAVSVSITPDASARDRSSTPDGPSTTDGSSTPDSDQSGGADD